MQSEGALELAARLRGIGISDGYASELANKTRDPSLELALRIYSELDVKLGPIAAATTDDIAALSDLKARGLLPRGPGRRSKKAAA